MGHLHQYLFLPALVFALMLPTAVKSEPPPCTEAAQAAFIAGQYQESAELAEKCWQATQHPRALYLAAMAHLALEQDAQAILALRQYLGGSLSGESARSVDAARARLKQLNVRTVPITLQVLPPVGNSTGVMLEAVRQAGANPVGIATSFRVDVSTLDIGASGLTLRLEPGVWRLKLSRAGYIPVERSLELQSGGGEAVLAFSMALEKQPSRSPSSLLGGAPDSKFVERRSDSKSPIVRAMKSGLTGAGAGTAAGGLALMIWGVVRRQATATCDVPTCTAELARSLRLRDTGAGLLGGGLGMMAGGLTWISRDFGVRRKVWIAEAVLGGAMITSGAIGLTISSRDFNKANTAAIDSWEEHYSSYGRIGAHAASATMFGLGVGLLTSAGASLFTQLLLVRRRGVAKSIHLAPNLGPGITLSGRF